MPNPNHFANSPEIPVLSDAGGGAPAPPTIESAAMKIRSDLRWFLLFGGLFLLTQDYLFHGWRASSTFLGLPGWLFYFAGVHLLFVGVFLWFSRSHWRERDD